jgi:3',5'-cyclic AMP phosphodiesterase CpdA
VPNHFSADSSLIKTDPYIFLEGGHDELINNSNTFYKPFEDDDVIFAHGRDPFFPAWEDTIQVNYFNPDAREFMIKTLMALTELCDGVRCDMAMLSLNDIFKRTWGSVVSQMGYEQPQDEFWKICIGSVKDVCPDFIFLAEVYWDLEGDLQQMGFDYTYDKRLTDRLRAGNVKDIREHLWAEKDFQKRSVRFIENHDEERAVTALGQEKSKAAAVVTSTLQGVHFYHDGQFEGKTIKLPVQLGREPFEPVNSDILEFYDKLLAITGTNLFKKGAWLLLEALPSWDGDNSYQNILTWLWKYSDDKRLVVINYSDEIATCRIKLDVKGYPQQFEIIDVLNAKTYMRLAEEVNRDGLGIRLDPYRSHIFLF